MINLNNEKNKSSVILNPERSEWVSRSHVTSVEPVVNAGAKTKRYSAKRDLYGPSLRSTLKMTALAFIFTLATTSGSSAGTWDCGESTNTVSCSLDENGVFTISGTGKMKDYDVVRLKNRPWISANIQTVVVGKGVTSIGDDAFIGASSLTSITIPDSVKSIGRFAFMGTTGLTNIICKGDEASCTDTVTALQASGYNGNISYQKEDNNGNTGGDDIGDVSGDFNPADCYNKGQVPYNNQCWAEYPFAKKRWTPAEANEWLHDGNDNFVVITFKK